jgi:excisionase family DNA binding protein
VPVPESSASERLALGEASRLLGVDPDTLRRWADEGRVSAFTTPGGHRRFDRRALERLIAERRTGPAGTLAGLGASPDGLSAGYRRRYASTSGPDPRESVPVGAREPFRELGRSLVAALARSVDESGTARAAAEREALDLAAELGAHTAAAGVRLADGVTMFIAARRPLLAELRSVAGRQGVEARRVADLYDAATGLLDRLLLAFVDAHEHVR